MKAKRILAILGIVFLLSLYVITFFAAITSSKGSDTLFVVSAWATVIIPIMIYAYMLIYKVFKKN